MSQRSDRGQRGIVLESTQEFESRGGAAHPVQSRAQQGEARRPAQSRAQQGESRRPAQSRAQRGEAHRPVQSQGRASAPSKRKAAPQPAPKRPQSQKGRRPSGSRMPRAILTMLFCIAAVALVAVGAWLLIKDDFAKPAPQPPANSTTQQAPQSVAGVDAQALEAVRQQAAEVRANLAEGNELGTVWVEGTQVNCGLYWGDSGTQFDRGAGCHSGNDCVLPGENGTVFIGAHTGTYFADLGSVQVGAIIHLDTTWGDFQYRVTETRVIKETDIDQCRWGEKTPSCILYTCYPFGQVTPTDQRFLVYADPVAKDENGVLPAGVMPAE